MRFIGKKLHKKYVRPISNKAFPKKVNKVVQGTHELNKEKAEITNTKKNKDEKKEKDMNDKAIQIENVLNDTKLPKRKVKVEKKDKGLYERTENSTILLTEDNKMLLND